MSKMFWVLCAAIVFSVRLGYADESKIKMSVAPAPPKLVKDSATGMEMAFVKGGCFQMGDTFGDGGSEERPVHELCLDDFYMGKFEVTQGQWKYFMGSNPSVYSSCGDNCPVDNVSWNDVQDYISRLNGWSDGSKSKLLIKDKSKQPVNAKNKLPIDVKSKLPDAKSKLPIEAEYRLPTEAEWEYAARSGGKNEKYSGGDVHDVAWFFANSEYEKTHPVGTKAPNGLGIYDMSGNVWEWTGDWYGSTYYSSSPRKNPVGPSTGDRRVARGGSWGVGPGDVRASYRNYFKPDYRSGSVGFRLIKTIPQIFEP